MKIAKKWWDDMNLEQQFYKIVPWLQNQNRSVIEIHPHNASDENIEEIYKFSETHGNN